LADADITDYRSGGIRHNTRMAQQAFTKPKAGLLTPHVAQIVADILAEVSREDTIPVAEYIEMLQTSPVIGSAVELKVLIALQKMGQYTNTDDKYKDFVLRNFEMMRGSLQLSIMELYSVGPIGFACAEWAPIQRDGSWMLDRIQILDPRKYSFYGKGGEVEHILYEGEDGDIIVPYDRVIHLTNQAHIAFGSVYGVAECKRAYAAYKAWKIVVAAALIAARRRGEPIMIGFADPNEQVSIGTNDDGSISYVNGPQALADSLQDLENNSVMATSIANKVQMVEAAEGDLILAVLKVLEQYQLLAFLVPESILTASGVGDSNLNTGHRSTLDATITATVNQIKERLIEDVVRPLLVWEFGENVESFGEFAVGDAQPEDGAIDILKVLIDAVYNNVFSAQDLDVINRMRTLAGLPSVTEIAQGLDAPPDEGIEDVAADDGAIYEEGDAPADEEPAATDAASVQFAAAPKASGRGGKGGKKGAGQKNCKKGVNCGGTCISAKRKCGGAKPSAKVKAKAKSKGGGGGGGEVKPKDDAPIVAPSTKPTEFLELLETPTIVAAATKSSRIRDAIDRLKDADKKMGAPVREKVRDWIRKNPGATEDIAVSAIAMAGQFGLMPNADLGTAAMLQGAIGVTARSGLRVGKRIKAELQAKPNALRSTQGIMATSKKVLSDLRGPGFREKLIGDLVGPVLGGGGGAAAGGGILGAIVGTTAAVKGTPIVAAAIEKGLKSKRTKKPKLTEAPA
jgi:hypothetical protein